MIEIRRPVVPPTHCLFLKNEHKSIVGVTNACTGEQDTLDYPSMDTVVIYLYSSCWKYLLICT